MPTRGSPACGGASGCHNRAGIVPTEIYEMLIPTWPCHPSLSVGPDPGGAIFIRWVGQPVNMAS